LGTESSALVTAWYVVLYKSSPLSYSSGKCSLKCRCDVAQYFAKLREEIIGSLPAEKQAAMVQCFTNLMDGIDRTLLTKNRDRSHERLTVCLCVVSLQLL